MQPREKPDTARILLHHFHVTVSGRRAPRVLAPGRPGGPDPLRVVLVDDRFLSRRGMEIVLSAQDGIEVVGAGDHSIDATGMAALAPDVVILEPDWDTLSKVRQAAPHARILMLDPGDGGPAADGRVARNVSGEELAMAVRRAGAGRFAP